LKSRVRVLGASLFVLSVAQILTGMVSSYIQLVILRCIIGACEGAFQPITGAIISSNFGSASSRGMSIFNWGIYLGYSLAYQFSKLFEVEHICGFDWRVAYMISGGVGVVIVPGMLLLVKVRRIWYSRESRLETHKSLPKMSKKT